MVITKRYTLMLFLFHLKFQMLTLHNLHRVHTFPQIWCTSEQGVVIRDVLRSHFDVANILECFWWQAGATKQHDRRKTYWNSASFQNDVMQGFVVLVKPPEHQHKGVLAQSFLDTRMLVAPVGTLPKTVGWSAATTNAAVPLEFLLKHTDTEDTVLDLWCGSGAGAVAAAFTGRHSISFGEDSEEVNHHPFYPAWPSLPLFTIDFMHSPCSLILKCFAHMPLIIPNR